MVRKNNCMSKGLLTLKTTLIIIWKHQFVNNCQNVWRKIVILTDISIKYESFGSIFTMIALRWDEQCPHISQIIMTWPESSS